MSSGGGLMSQIDQPTHGMCSLCESEAVPISPLTPDELGERGILGRDPGLVRRGESVFSCTFDPDDRRHYQLEAHKWGLGTEDETEDECPNVGEAPVQFTSDD